MPFTFSHPAIVLPLVFLPRKWFSLTGLIIGSLTPDFEYFIRMKIQSDYSHTVGGLFWFDLPLGLLLAFLFHNLVRNSLFDNSPPFLKSRFSLFRQFNWNHYFKKNVLVVVVSILIGAASHLFWDSFTHPHGYFIERLPALSQSIQLFGKDIPFFKILQHSSTVLGGLAIAFVIYQLPTHKITNKKINPNYWIILFGLTISIVLVRFINGHEINQYGNVIVTAISAGLLSLILTPLLLNREKKLSD